jgi:hypothetical protein
VIAIEPQEAASVGDRSRANRRIAAINIFSSYQYLLQGRTADNLSMNSPKGFGINDAAIFPQPERVRKGRCPIW